MTSPADLPAGDVDARAGERKGRMRAMAFGLDRARLTGLLRQLTILGLRSCNIGSKFLLALYTARFLGLADLGVYGLLSGAATGLPAVVGFGLTAWIMRRLVDLPRAQAIPLMFTRLGVVIAAHAVLQPIGWLCNEAAGAPVSHQRMLLIGLILLLENLTADIGSMLTARRRILTGEVLMFVRAGLWPLPVMLLGVLEPQARTLDLVLIGWIAGLLLAFAGVAAFTACDGRWRQIAFAWPEIFTGMREGIALYAHDLCLAFNLYLDRFLISLFLGMELTGVYTFFWSFANVGHALAIYGVLTPQIPKLVAGASGGRTEAFTAIERRLVREIAIWAGLICGAISVALPIMLPLVARAELGQHLAIFWIVAFGTLLRIAADTYGYILYAMRRDAAVAQTSLGATVASASLNLLFIPFAGIVGAAAAYVVTYAGQFAARFVLSRRLPG